MRRRYYFDTSVFGGVFDEEFSEFSIRLFDQVKREEVICLYSEIVESELLNAPTHVTALANDISWENMEYLKIIASVKHLAHHYVKEGIIGSGSFDDGQHIAIATVYRADILVSWSFKHIVNTNRIKGYNSVNLKFGYKPIEILSPKQLYNHEEENNEKEERF